MARKIEEQMRSAAFDIRNWHNSNTEVRVAKHAGMDVAEVFLFGKHIANVFQVRHDQMQVDVIEQTLKDWPTATTLSRLNALGANVHRRNNKVYLNDRYIADAR